MKITDDMLAAYADRELDPDQAREVYAAAANDRALADRLLAQETLGPRVSRAYDHVLDEPTDAYLERYTFWGQTFLDAASWRHYLPHWIDYAVRHATDRTTMVVDGLLASLRPPDREPPRLASLTREQEAVVVTLLQHAASGSDPVYDAVLARQVLEEWWMPNARFRPARGAGA